MVSLNKPQANKVRKARGYHNVEAFSYCQRNMEIVEGTCSRRSSDQNSHISVPLVLDCPLLCHRLQAVGRPLTNV